MLRKWSLTSLTFSGEGIYYVNHNVHTQAEVKKLMDGLIKPSILTKSLRTEQFSRLTRRPDLAVSRWLYDNHQPIQSVVAYDELTLYYAVVTSIELQSYGRPFVTHTHDAYEYLPKFLDLLEDFETGEYENGHRFARALAFYGAHRLQGMYGRYLKSWLNTGVIL